jgi:hypothetical protein
MSFGQLFPKVADFHGDIEKVTEKRYGKELNPTKNDSGVFKPGKYSGWKYTYLFDENSKLAKRTNSFQNKILTDCTYLRSKTGDRIIEQEIVQPGNKNQPASMIEYENFTDPEGRIAKVNFWAVDQQKNTRELFLVETNAHYKQGKLKSFTRHNVSRTGELDAGEECELFYDTADRLIRIERKDIESDLKTVLYYTYNNSGFLDHYSVDFLVGLPVYGKNPKQDIYYKCDTHGNWVRKYWLSGEKKLVEAKRIIKYK